MREEVSSPAVTLGAQLRNAAVNGFSDAVTSLSGILIFAMNLMNYGPSLLLWAVILFSRCATCGAVRAYSPSTRVSYCEDLY